MTKVVGIDLGTTNSVVAVLEGGEPVVIPSAEGGRIVPSVVGFSKTGERIVGELAKRQAVANPDRTVRSIKRLMGTKTKVKIEDREYSPQEISAMILQKLKKDAESYLGEKIEKAVITVPAYFNDNQRKATKDAGVIAGLEVLRIINEPTASALAYGLDKEGDQTILVFDLGGGTFDVSILEIGEGVFEVKATAGDTQLGGDDWDQIIIDWLIDEFKKEHEIDLSKDSTALQRLKEAAEKAKIELSGVTQTSITLPFIASNDEGPLNIDVTLSRAKMEQMTKELAKKALDTLKSTIADANLKPEDIDKVLLVGGTTRMPDIQKRVKNFFGKEPYKNINPDECVAIGAAIQAGVLMGEVDDVLLLDVTPLTLGIETLGGVFTKLVDRNTTIPVQKKQIFSTASDNQTSVEIHVLQGERAMAADNITLGRFHLMGIPPAPRGIPQIEVSFDIDANGILNVSAKDTGTGNEQKITITASSGLSDDDIKKMTRDSEKYAAEDQNRREAVETHNQLDSMIYAAEKLIKDLGEKVDKAKREKLESSIDAAKKALSNNEVGEMKSATETLTEQVNELSIQLYQQQAKEKEKATSKASEAKKEPAPSDDNVVDAEYEVVEEDDGGK